MIRLRTKALRNLPLKTKLMNIRSIWPTSFNFKTKHLRLYAPILQMNLKKCLRRKQTKVKMRMKGRSMRRR